MPTRRSRSFRAISKTNRKKCSDKSIKECTNAYHCGVYQKNQKTHCRTLRACKYSRDPSTKKCRKSKNEHEKAARLFYTSKRSRKRRMRQNLQSNFKQYKQALQNADYDAYVPAGEESYRDFDPSGPYDNYVPF